MLAFPRLVTKTNKQSKIFYPLAQSTWDEEEHHAIIQQLNTGQLTMGKKMLKILKKILQVLSEQSTRLW